MQHKGLLFQVSAIERGTTYDRFRAWRRIAFEAFGKELTIEDGMTLSLALPSKALDLLCALFEKALSDAEKKRLLERFNAYYFGYLYEELPQHEELILRRGKILEFAAQQGMKTCLIIPFYSGQIAEEYRALFDNICSVPLNESIYTIAARSIGLRPEECVLVLSEADDEDYARATGITAFIDDADFDI